MKTNDQFNLLSTDLGYDRRNSLWNVLTRRILFSLLWTGKTLICKSKFIFNEISQQFSRIQKAIDWILSLINIERFISEETANLFSIVMIVTYLVFIITFYIIIYVFLSNV